MGRRATLLPEGSVADGARRRTLRRRPGRFRRKNGEFVALRELLRQRVDQHDLTRRLSYRVDIRRADGHSRGLLHARLLGPGGCTLLPNFRLSGPGANIVTTLTEAQGQKNPTGIDLLPSSTYTWTSDAVPGVVHTFMTSAQVEGSPPTPGTSSGSAPTRQARHLTGHRRLCRHPVPGHARRLGQRSRQARARLPRKAGRPPQGRQVHDRRLGFEPAARASSCRGSSVPRA